ncbi:hypothetical protein EDD11_002054 [Mortierella claussenii]|nr:hypothetical protein EDD11_002054 [Mortierella claussenii]
MTHFVALAVLSLAIIIVQMITALATPYGEGSAGSDFETHIPVSPITIAPETDFLPVSNIQPVINVLPTDYNDYSGLAGYNYGDDGSYLSPDFARILDSLALVMVLILVTTLSLDSLALSRP